MDYTEPAWEPGHLVGHYVVGKPLAVGGLGTVYLAEDRKLNRRVALKVLHAPSSAAGYDTEALLREARAAAALNHPNIVSIYELTEASGRLILVMEWVDGEPLSARSGTITPLELRAVARDLASALAAAHQAGIVHGDIKPANVIAGKDGRVRLLDFGIARRMDEEVQAALFSGTIPYMSPEILHGAGASPRSDLWALGVLLYELAAGRRPFVGDYEAAIQYAIMHSQPAPLASLRPDLPADLAGAIDKLLSKNPEQGFASAQDLLETLSKDQGEQHKDPVKSGRRTRLLALAGTVATVIVFAYVLFGRQAPARGRVVAVLPFESLGDSTRDYFAVGMTEAVSCLLAADTQLSVIARRSVTGYQHSSTPLSEIARELAADYLVTGTIQHEAGRDSDRLRISVSLSQPGDGKTLWAHVYNSPSSDLFQMQEHIAQDVSAALGLGTVAQEPLPAYTEDLQAYDLYLRGNDYFNRDWSAGNIQFAIDMYEEAVQLDSTYAAAHAMLARCHAEMFWEYYDRSEERCAKALAAAQRALELNPRLADGHLALGDFYYQCKLDFAHALDAFRQALKLEPKNAEVLNAMAAVERRQNNLDGALEHFQASLALDPRSYMKAFDLGLTYGVLREFDQANRWLDRSIELGPDFQLAHIYKAWLAILQNGDRQTAGLILSRAPAGAHLERSHYYWWLQRIVASDLHVLAQRVPSLDDTACYFLFKSQIYRLTHQQALQTVYADSARHWLEPRVGRALLAVRYFSYLGLACANLGQKEQAVQYGMKALDMLPYSQDSFDHLFLLLNLAEILEVVGKPDEAVTQLRDLVSMPGFVSRPYLKVDPLWASLQDRAPFQALLQAEP